MAGGRGFRFAQEPKFHFSPPGERQGRKPCEQSRNLGSRTVSSTIFRACGMILSKGEEIPSGRSFPFALGMYTRRPGFGL